MKRKNHIATLCIALLGLGLAALPAAAAVGLVDLRAEIQSRGQRAELYSIKPSQPVPLAVGETVRLALVGTTGNGAQVPVDAAFSLTAGGSSVRLGRAGAGGNGLAQVGYRVTDGRYTMRGGYTVGRVTFQMGGGGPAEVAPGGDARREAARRVTRALYRTLLGDDLRSQRAQDDVQRIDRRGYGAIRQVAAEVAQAAEAQHTFAGQSAFHVMGTLYRGLLGRQQDDNQLVREDSGFRGSVEGLRRNGLTRAVEDIVSSPEFQSVHHLQDSGLL